MAQVEKSIQKAPQTKQTLEQKDRAREGIFQKVLNKAIDANLSDFSLEQKKQVIELFNKLTKEIKKLDIKAVF